jgi:hypothetical protein
MEAILLLVLLIGAFIFIGLFGKIAEFFLWFFGTAFAVIFTFLWSGVLFVVGLFVVIFLISMALSNL